MTLLAQMRRQAELVLRSDEEIDEWDPDDEAAAGERVAVSCYFEQKARVEPELAGEVSEATYFVAFPPGRAEELSTGDAFVVDGEVYEIIGDPYVVAPTGVTSHVEVTAKHTGTEDSS